MYWEQWRSNEGVEVVRQRRETPKIWASAGRLSSLACPVSAPKDPKIMRAGRQNGGSERTCDIGSVRSPAATPSPPESITLIRRPCTSECDFPGKSATKPTKKVHATHVVSLFYVKIFVTIRLSRTDRISHYQKISGKASHGMSAYFMYTGIIMYVPIARSRWRGQVGSGQVSVVQVTSHYMCYNTPKRFTK